MARAFDKDILRSITGSWGRFLAIMGIVALGCGFYAGLRMTAPDMDMAADAYYDATELMDIRVVSTLGLADDDLAAISALDGVESVMGAYETDVMVTLDEEQYAVRVHSLPYGVSELTSGEISDATADAEGASAAVDAAWEARDGWLNELVLEEGRWPVADEECIISADVVMSSPVALGDVIRIDEGVQDVDDVLSQRGYRIVGFAHSPYYVSTSSMGSTTLGSGTVEQFMYIPSDGFKADVPYTEAFIQVAGAKELTSGSFDYQSRVDEVVKEISGIAPAREQARLAQVKADAQRTLDEARAEYEEQRQDADAQLASAQQELDDAAATLDRSRQELASGRAEHEAGERELAWQRQVAEEGFADGQAQIDDQRSQLDALKAQLDASAPQLAAAWAQAGISPDQASGVIQQLKAELAALDPTDPASADAARVLQERIGKLEALVAMQADHDTGIAGYEKGMRAIAEAQDALDRTRSDAEQQIASGQAALDAAAARIANGRAQLAAGEEELASGQASFDEERTRAEDELARAQDELARAQEDIDAIEAPEWLIMDRTKNPGVVSFASDADRVDSIASFFPFIFFLVAALVALTTMTRMVEEERVLIGTFKALGYSRARITSKYLIYAAAASITGSVLGIVALSLILPPVIMEAYAIIYSVPHALVMPLDAGIALSSAGLGVGITLVATWAAVGATLREDPARLMLPRAPKEGKRILLERIGPLWRRLSFSWKVTLRNIFRYKRRLVMTVIGIAGCTGLLLTGLGLSDAVNDIIDKQYGQTVLYNVQVTGDDDLDEEGRDALASLAPESAFAFEEPMMASGPDASDISVSMIVPEDADRFQELWVMRTRVDREPLSLGGDGIIITEKLARLLGVEVGDELTLAEQDAMGNATSTTYALQVSGIMENYVANYAFLSSALYEATFGKAPDAKALFAKVDGGEGGYQAFREAARAIPGVKTVAFNDEVVDTYKKMLSSVNMIVVVLVIAAAALAFIVLYNLTNINITERQREIATLKVLGFTPHEVDMYIYREIIILTILGALVGLAFGTVLEGFVIVTAEVDYVMFGREIHLMSYAIAFVVTIAFAAVVMLFMRRKLASIDMIESLKSNE